VNPSNPAAVLPTQVETSIRSRIAGISNTRRHNRDGETERDPQRATSQWYINLADNFDLDTQNGGFTVFGLVLGNGM